MPKLREVFADFNRLEDRPGIGLSVLLGPEDVDPDLMALCDGERILMVEPENLSAEGIAHSVESAGRRYWYGVLTSRSDIHNIHREATAKS
jgi:hypothetical protein